MADTIPRGLEWSLLLHFFVGAFFGISFLIFPDALFAAAAWKYPLDPVITRLLGGALIGFGVNSLLAWREKELKSVKLSLEVEIVWLVIAVVVSIWGAIDTMSWMGWLAFGLFVAFLLDFGYYYFKSF